VHALAGEPGLPAFLRRASVPQRTALRALAPHAHHFAHGGSRSAYLLPYRWIFSCLEGRERLGLHMVRSRAQNRTPAGHGLESRV
jgi:hypothetical protein